MNNYIKEQSIKDASEIYVNEMRYTEGAKKEKEFLAELNRKPFLPKT